MEMVLKEEELTVTGKYIRSHLKEWLPETLFFLYPLFSL